LCPASPAPPPPPQLYGEPDVAPAPPAFPCPEVPAALYKAAEPPPDPPDSPWVYESHCPAPPPPIAVNSPKT